MTETIDLPDLHNLLQKDVMDVHDFIAAWFRGEAEQSESAFEQGFSGRLSGNLINIQPSGQVLTHGKLVSSIWQEFGTNKNFTIEIFDFHLVQWFAEAKLALAIYRERQRGAKNTAPPDNIRLTTVLFHLAANSTPPVWLHLHETAIPKRENTL